MAPVAAMESAQACCDVRAERDLLRRAADAESALRDAIEKKRSNLVHQREALDQKVAVVEAELEKQRSASKEIEREAMAESNRGDVGLNDLNDIVDEAEEVEDDIKAANAKLADLRIRAGKMKEDNKFELDVARSLHRLYTGMTGIRWNYDVDGATSGYVALDTVKHFDVKGYSEKESHDLVWETIEACLKVGA